jgi:hypothetical protein
MLIQIYYLSIKKLKNNLILLIFLKAKNISKIIYIIFFKYLFCLIFKMNYFYLILKINDIDNIFFKLKYFFKLSCVQLLDLIIVDRLEIKLNEKKRFNFTYVLLSLINNLRIFVNGFLGLFETLPSLYKLYKASD